MCTLLIHHNGGGGVEQFLKSKLTKQTIQLYKQGKQFVLVLPTAQVQRYTSVRALIIRLMTCQITEISVQHLWGHTLEDIEVLLAELKCPYSVYLHDHYACCPRLFFVTNDNRYCEMELNPDQCNQCVGAMRNGQMRQTINKMNPSVLEWRNQFHSLYQKADTISAPSQSTKQNYLRYFPDLTIEVEPHQVAQLTPKAATDHGHSILHIAVIGNVFSHKGEQPLLELLKRSQNRPIRYYSYGKVAPSLQKQANLIERGPYSKDTLGKHLNDDQIDLVCIPSICPETFSFTTHEAINLGYPVLCFKLGAQAEAVVEKAAGWVVEPFTGEALFKQMIRLTKDLNQIKTKKEEMRSHFN